MSKIPHADGHIQRLITEDHGNTAGLSDIAAAAFHLILLGGDVVGKHHGSAVGDLEIVGIDDDSLSQKGFDLLHFTTAHVGFGIDSLHLLNHTARFLTSGGR